MAVSGINTLSQIVPVQPLSTPSVTGASQVTGSEGVSFESMLQNALNNVNQLQLDADSLASDFAAGKTDSIQSVMVASEKADISLQFAMQVRNKILDAYTEIMRMQV